MTSRLVEPTWIPSGVAKPLDGTVTGEHDISTDKESILTCALDKFKIPVC